MRTINPLKAGVALGLVTGLFHAAWAALVATGYAQAVVDFILRLHFIAPFMKVEPFALPTAGLLVGVTAAIGFVMGLVLGMIWNGLHHD
ncbi:MAG: hypothetical protein K1X35_00380 [Caulobacteraceae bacterium]|nr:hypothetical protein [Caulobacteraceae bacterium]